MDRDIKIMIAAIAALLALMIYISWYEFDECKSKGGEMVGTGRYSTMYIQEIRGYMFTVADMMTIQNIDDYLQERVKQ